MNIDNQAVTELLELAVFFGQHTPLWAFLPIFVIMGIMFAFVRFLLNLFT